MNEYYVRCVEVAMTEREQSTWLMSRARWMVMMVESATRVTAASLDVVEATSADASENVTHRRTQLVVAARRAPRARRRRRRR